MEYGEIVDGAELSLDEIVRLRSKQITTGSGAKLKLPAFDGPSMKSVPKGIRLSGEALGNMLKDRRLMEWEPMLHTYLKFANTQLALGETDHWDAYGYLSDPCYNIVRCLFFQMSHIPSAAELRQLQQEDPQAYQTCMVVKEYLDAYAEYHAADLLTDPGKADREDTAAKEAERLRRLDRLQQAAQAFANTPKAVYENYL